MTISDLEFLATKEGGLLLEELSSLTWSERHKFLFKTEKERRSQVSTASAIIEAREKAEGKFSRSEKMFFTSLGLEQSSSEKISNYIAERFRSDWRVADLGCGIGGNLLALAQKSKKVFALDDDKITLTCAKLNAKVYELENKIEFFNLKAEEFIGSEKMKNIQAVFLDPARDREGKTKTRSILNSRPNLLEILPEIFKITKNVAVKISPAFDWQEISLLPEDPELEVISENNTCKVAILWFGELKKFKRSLACFRNNGDYFFNSDKGYLEVQSEIEEGQPKFLFEPDKAFIKSGLSEEWAQENNLKKVDLSARYLGSDKKIKGPGRTLETIFLEEISLRDLKKELTKRKIERAEISAKNHFLKPDEIRKKLKLKEGGEFVIIFIENCLGKKLVFLGKKF
ncbi:hypothetical protein JXK06_03655 [Patescibacteria group bacterium]|nr:hypothetical protein [Patescibacteria group bacterium]